jgi:uncharacterized protein DUF664
MIDDIVLNITVHDPSPDAGEVEMLRFALNRVRAQFAWKCGGLDAAGLARRQPPSTVTLGGLVKHLALVEDHYVARDVTGEPIVEPWRSADFEADPSWDWHSAADDTPAELYTLWRDAVTRSDAAWAAALAAGGLDQRSKFVTPSGENVNLRRVLVDLIEEYLRHTGHADLLREAVDGLVGNDPPRP